MLPTSIYRHAARAAILATCIAATAHGSAPGDVDPTFGVSGRTVVAEHSKAIGLMLPDGSLLVASQATEAVANIPVILELRRFDREGHADPNFGTAGIAHHGFPDMTDLMQSAVRAADGRVYFGGWTRHVRDGRGWLDLAVYAVDARGGAVTTFGDGGLVSYDLKEDDNARGFDSAAALAVLPDGHLLAAGFSASTVYGEGDLDRLPQLLRLNADGSLDRNIGFGQGSNVCSGIAGLLVRTDGALLIGDDTGIYALLDDTVLQAFGVDGHVVDEHWYPYAGCTGTRSFAANPSGELLTLSAVNLRDGQLGIALSRLQDNGTRVDGAAQAPPVPLARLVRDDARFTGLSVYHIVTSRPVQNAEDDRVYVLFGFSWSSASADDFGGGWAIARFAEDGTLDTGWGKGGVVVLEKGGHGYWNAVPTLLEPLPNGRIVAMSANGVLTRLFGGQREGHGAINLDAGRDYLEDAVQVSIEVTRSGGSKGAVSVEYSTTGDIDAERATEGRDFTAVNGRLDWADGDTSPREIVVPILEDTLRESDERFAVDIRSPSGGAVLLNTRALLGINDDLDTPASPPPPPPSPPPIDGGGGATDGLTLILLISLIVLSVARRRRQPCHPARAEHGKERVMAKHAPPGCAAGLAICSFVPPLSVFIPALLPFVAKSHHVGLAWLR